jgi:hypothetical protein
VAGVPAQEAIDGYLYLPKDLGDVPEDWDQVAFSIRCRDCAERLGEATAIAGR